MIRSIKIFFLFFLKCKLIFTQVNDLKIYNTNFVESIDKTIDPTTITGTRFFDYHSGIKKPYLFNGNFSFAYTFNPIENLKNKNSKLLHCFQFNPEIKIRIFQNDTSYNDKSKPVRTPSYIPKISYYVSTKNLWSQEKMNRYFFGVSALHHSNGQDGWEFDYEDSVVNLYNGSFSESLYFHFIIGGNSIVKKDENQLFWKLLYEYHPKFFSNEKLYESKLYGGNRFQLNLIFQKKKKSQNLFFENHRLQLNMEYISDLTYHKGNLKKSEKIKFLEANKRFNIVLTYYKTILKSRHLGLFGQLAYFGSDNYNIYFQQSMFSARTGITFGNFY